MDALAGEINNFVASSRGLVLSARESLLTGSFSRLDEILDEIQSNPAAVRITETISTSLDSLDDLSRRLDGLRIGSNVIRGLTLVAAGAILWGSQLALGPIIGVLLMILGMSVAFPAMGELIERRIESWWDEKDF